LIPGHASGKGSYWTARTAMASRAVRGWKLLLPPGWGEAPRNAWKGACFSLVPGRTLRPGICSVGEYISSRTRSNRKSPSHQRHQGSRAAESLDPFERVVPAYRPWQVVMAFYASRTPLRWIRFPSVSGHCWAARLNFTSRSYSIRVYCRKIATIPAPCVGE
jgi:hypothetical protein